MGQAWADDENSPTIAKIDCLGICYVAGDATLPQARELLRQITKGYELQVNNEVWHNLIQDELSDKIYKFTRFKFKRNFSLFDSEKLQTYIQALPNIYEVRLIDEAIFHHLPTVIDSHCEQFSSFSQFEKHGIGVVVLHEGEPVCAASPYVYCDGIIDVQIDTLPQHQRNGLATACAARLILECMGKGVFPNWDADCDESRYLAEKLGYQLDKECVCYEITARRKNYN